MSHKFEKRCQARQNEIRDGSVLAHVTKRIAAITPPRALVVLRFLLNTSEETDRIWPNPTTPCYLTNDSRSAETGEIFGLVGGLPEAASATAISRRLSLIVNEHSPQQAAGYLTLAIRGPLTRASTALIPLSGFLVRAHSAPPSPNLLSPPLFQGSSHPTNIVLPIAPFFPIVLAVTLLALLCSYISARSSRALVLDALRIASVRDPYRIPIPPSRSHIVPLSLLSSPPTPSVLSFLSMPSDILPASLRDNVSPTHNAILALIRLFPPSLPSSFLKKSATP